MYWSRNSEFFQVASVLVVMYGVLLIYVKYTYFSDSVALFFSYVCITGVLLLQYSPVQWVWVVGAVTSLASDRILGYKKWYDYRWIATIIMLMMPQHPWYLGAVFSVCVYGVAYYYTAFQGPFRQDDLWRYWGISIVCTVLMQRNLEWHQDGLIYGVQGFAALTMLAGLWHKKYRESFPYGVSLVCAPWLYIVTKDMTWVVSTMGLVHWIHHVLMHDRMREVSCMTQTMAYMLLGGMISICLICAALCLWLLASQGRGNVLILAMYGISCIVQFEGVYLKLRSKKFNLSTVLESYMVGLGILIWSVWSGWIINQQMFFQFLAKM